MAENQGYVPIYVTAAELGTFLGVTSRRVFGLAKDGIIPKARSKGFDLRECVQGYCGYLRTRAGSVSPNLGGGATGDHRERLIKARADLAEMEAAQLAGQLVQIDLAEATWSEATARVRQRMLSVAPKAAPIVAVETNAEICHEVIEAFVHEALAELAGTELQVSDRFDEGGSEPIQDTGTASETDDIGMGGPVSETV